MPDHATPDDSGRLRTEMQFISELCTVVAGSSELQPILDWLTGKASELLGGGACSIRLLDADQATTHTIVLGDRGGAEAGTASWPLALKSSVMGFLMATRAELATPDVLADARFAMLRGLTSPVRSLLALPLFVDGRVTGMIALGEPVPGREWTSADVQLMRIVASHSAGVLEKARLRSEAEEKRRLEQEAAAMEKELLLARDIQMRLIPESPLDAGPLRAEGRVVPAKQVGGDYFDYFPLSGGRFGAVIADVSGKGVPASLLVSTVQGTLRAFADGARTPAAVVHEINRAVARHAGAGRFVTLFYAEVDPGASAVRYVNAGHNWPLLRRADGTLEPLREGGLPLGMFEDATYAEGSATFAATDALLLFSDGIPEATDFFRAEFGDERLEALWRAWPGGAPASFVAAIMDAVAEFRGAAPQSDDMTAVVIAARAGN